MFGKNKMDNQPPMECVYAGPDVMENRLSYSGMGMSYPDNKIEGMKKICFACGTENPDEAKFCKNCGKPFDEPEMKRVYAGPGMMK